MIGLHPSLVTGFILLSKFSFKPIHFSQLLAPVRDQFEKLFFETFSGKKNKKFLGEIQVSVLLKWGEVSF